MSDQGLQFITHKGKQSRARKCARNFWVFAVAALTAGCASMPEVEVGHFLPTATASFTVTQSATCTAGSLPVLTTEATPAIAFASDPNKRRALKIGELGGAFGKQDAGFEFYADGRLKGVNAKGTGQAGEGLKALIKLAPIFGLVSTPSDDVKKACEKIREIAGDGKALTIVSRGQTDFAASSEGTITFSQISVNAGLYDSVLQPIFGRVQGKYTIRKASKPHVATLEGKDQQLTLVEPATAVVNIAVKIDERQVFEQPYSVLVPQHGEEYVIPVQKAPWFGNNEMELQVDGSGKVTKLRYAGAADTAGALGVLGDAWTTANQKPAAPTAADQAKSVQADADLIYQQQRLVICQADPTKCPK